MTPDEIEDKIWKKARCQLRGKGKTCRRESLRAYERYIMLNIIDSQWKDHLLSIDHVKQGIGLVGYGQKDPLVEYKKQSFEMFQDMLDRIDTHTTRRSLISKSSSRTNRKKWNGLNAWNASGRGGRRRAWRLRERWRPPTAAGDTEAVKHTPFVREQPKVKPNEPCYCGSGKKFKKCHGGGI
jgi:preprotein translocase subunit SecA